MFCVSLKVCSAPYFIKVRASLRIWERRNIMTRNSGKFLLAFAAISLSSLFVINSAHAQSAAVRAAARSGASQSLAEQVRRDANSTKCRPVVRKYISGDFRHTHRYQTICWGESKIDRPTRH
jgi:hypothetical protein